MKQTKTKMAHTPNSSKATTTTMGTGIKNPLGKNINSYIMPKTAKTIGKPPKSLA